MSADDVLDAIDDALNYDAYGQPWEVDAMRSGPDPDVTPLRFPCGFPPLDQAFADAITGIARAFDAMPEGLRERVLALGREGPDLRVDLR